MSKGGNGITAAQPLWTEPTRVLRGHLGHTGLRGLSWEPAQPVRCCDSLRTDVPSQGFTGNPRNTASCNNLDTDPTGPQATASLVPSSGASDPTFAVSSEVLRAPEPRGNFTRLGGVRYRLCCCAPLPPRQLPQLPDPPLSWPLEVATDFATNRASRAGKELSRLCRGPGAAVAASRLRHSGVGERTRTWGGKETELLRDLGKEARGTAYPPRCPLCSAPPWPEKATAPPNSGAETDCRVQALYQLPSVTPQGAEHEAGQSTSMASVAREAHSVKDYSLRYLQRIRVGCAVLGWGRVFFFVASLFSDFLEICISHPPPKEGDLSATPRLPPLLDTPGSGTLSRSLPPTPPAG